MAARAGRCGALDLQVMQPLMRTPLPSLRAGRLTHLPFASAEWGRLLFGATAVAPRQATGGGQTGVALVHDRGASPARLFSDVLEIHYLRHAVRA